MNNNNLNSIQQKAKNLNLQKQLSHSPPTQSMVGTQNYQQPKQNLTKKKSIQTLDLASAKNYTKILNNNANKYQNQQLNQNEQQQSQQKSQYKYLNDPRPSHRGEHQPPGTANSDKERPKPNLDSQQQYNSEQKSQYQSPKYNPQKKQLDPSKYTNYSSQIQNNNATLLQKKHNSINNISEVDSNNSSQMQSQQNQEKEKVNRYIISKKTKSPSTIISPAKKVHSNYTNLNNKDDTTPTTRPGSNKICSSSNIKNLSPKANITKYKPYNQQSHYEKNNFNQLMDDSDKHTSAEKDPKQGFYKNKEGMSNSNKLRQKQDSRVSSEDGESAISPQHYGGMKHQNFMENSNNKMSTVHSTANTTSLMMGKDNASANQKSQKVFIRNLHNRFNRNSKNYVKTDISGEEQNLMDDSSQYQTTNIRGARNSNINNQMSTSQINSFDGQSVDENYNNMSSTTNKKFGGLSGLGGRPSISQADSLSMHQSSSQNTSFKHMRSFQDLQNSENGDHHNNNNTKEEEKCQVKKDYSKAYNMLSEMDDRKNVFQDDNDVFVMPETKTSTININKSLDPYESFLLKDGVWNQMQTTATIFNYFTIRVQGMPSPLQISIASGDRNKVMKNFKIFVSDIEEHPTKFNAIYTFQSQMFSIDANNGMKNKFQQNDLFFSIVNYSSDITLKICYQFGRAGKKGIYSSNKLSPKLSPKLPDSVIANSQNTSRRTQFKKSVQEDIREAKTEKLAMEVNKILEKKRQQNKVNNNFIQQHIEQNKELVVQHTQQFKKQKQELMQQSVNFARQEAKMKSTRIEEDQAQQKKDMIMRKQQTRAQAQQKQYQEIKKYRKNAHCFYWLTIIKMAQLAEYLKNRVQREKNNMKHVTNYVLFYKRPFYNYKLNIRPDCAGDLNKRLLKNALETLKSRAIIKKPEIQEKCEFMIMDVLEQTAESYDLKRQMIKYYKYATYVKKKLYNLTKKYRKFKVMLDVMWQKYYKMALRQILTVNKKMLDHVKNENELSIFKEYAQTDLKQQFIDIYVQRCITRYRDNCKKVFGNNKQKFRVAQAFVLNSHYDSNRRFLERDTNNIITEMDVEVKVSYKESPKKSKKQNSNKNSSNKKRYSESINTTTISGGTSEEQKSPQSADLDEEDEDDYEDEENNHRPQQNTLFVFPDFEQLRALIKEAVIHKNSINKTLATKISLKEVEDGLYY